MQAYRCPGLPFNPPASLAITSTKFHHTSCTALFKLRGNTTVRTNTSTSGGIPMYCYSGIAGLFARQAVSNKFWHAYQPGYASQLQPYDHLFYKA